MSTNISKKKRDDLLDKIKQIRAFIAAAPQDENTGNLLSYLSELEKDVNGKKYGLVFEEHREEIDEVLNTHTPVLTEEADLFIDHGGQMNFLLEGDNLAALKLLEKTHRGKIDLIYIDPPYNTGNKDFIYQIKKEDVIAYLENRKVFPESYSAPAGWYKGDYTVQMEEQVPPIVREHLRLYYTELLSCYPDVLTTQEVSKITGYGKTAINNWCNQGHIKSFRKNNVNHIPKVYLVEFFCSTYFRTITRKSLWHIRTLQGFSSWRKIRDLHTADSEGGTE